MYAGCTLKRLRVVQARESTHQHVGRDTRSEICLAGLLSKQVKSYQTSLCGAGLHLALSRHQGTQAVNVLDLSLDSVSCAVCCAVTTDWCRPFRQCRVRLSKSDLLEVSSTLCLLLRLRLCSEMS